MLYFCVSLYCFYCSMGSPDSNKLKKKTNDNLLSRFHLMPERDGRTNRQTYRFAISISRVSVLTRDKNAFAATPSPNPLVGFQVGGRREEGEKGINEREEKGRGRGKEEKGGIKGKSCPPKRQAWIRHWLLTCNALHCWRGIKTCFRSYTQHILRLNRRAHDACTYIL